MFQVLYGSISGSVIENIDGRGIKFDSSHFSLVLSWTEKATIEILIRFCIVFGNDLPSIIGRGWF